MDKTKKKRVKRYISWICLAVLVIALTAMPLLASTSEETDGPTASILSGSVQTGSIETALHGGGTLDAESAVEVTLPYGVQITEFLVANGDLVSQGDALATVDRVTVMSAITQVQEALETLTEEMSDATDEAVSSTVTTLTGGRVKVIYAQAGESVEDVMLRDGALAVLSLDGLMAVQIQRYTSLSAGDSVCVTLEDDTEVTGRVESNLDGVLTVTIEDEGYAVGEKAKVTTEDGSRIGSGTLYIHNAWKATAYAGTISKVNVSEESTVSAGATLFTLTDTEYAAQFSALAAQRQEYEALMFQLFQLYQQETVYAPCDGMVSGVDEDSALLLSDSGQGWFLSLLTNAPDGNDEAVYSHYVGMVTGLDSGTWELVLNPEQFTVADYLDLSGVSTDAATMTENASYVPLAPVYEYTDGAWTQVEADAIAVGDVLLFACSESGDGFVWIIRISSEEETPTDPGTEETQPGTETDPTDPTESEGDGQTTGGTEDNRGGQSGVSGGSYSFSGSATQEEEDSLYSLDGNTLLSVTPQGVMTMTISVDESDINKLSLGQSVEIYVEALKNQTFTAYVSEIGISGTSSGGSSKFSVVLTMDKAEDMLPGMSATASLSLSVTEDVLTIPVAALVEDGAETIVYTGYDESTGTLTDPVSVTLGVSDGENAEILSGLSQGDTYYYAYYDTLEISNEVEAASSSFSFSFG